MCPLLFDDWRLLNNGTRADYENYVRKTTGRQRKEEPPVPAPATTVTVDWTTVPVDVSNTTVNFVLYRVWRVSDPETVAYGKTLDDAIVALFNTDGGFA